MGYSTILRFISNKSGLEIGGPSRIFRKQGLIPIYSQCERIDQCNFAKNTIWSSANGSPNYGASAGEQFVAEASQLEGIPADKYGFVVASHVLEHTANPLAALLAWKRVLTPEGIVLVVVPDKRATFDHKRPFTSFEHVLEDYQSGRTERDLSHLNEIVANHDLRLDPPAGTSEQLRERCLRNFEFRAMHHHVFSPALLEQMFTYVGMEVLVLIFERPEHIVAVAQKSQNEVFEEIGLRNRKVPETGARFTDNPSAPLS